MKWYEQLRSERLARGWTQRLLAEKIGTNKFTVVRWENGAAFPTRFYREQLTTMLGIDFEEREFVQAVAAGDCSTSEKSALPSKGEGGHHKHEASLPQLILAVSQPVKSPDQDDQHSKQQRHQTTEP